MRSSGWLLNRICGVAESALGSPAIRSAGLRRQLGGSVPCAGTADSSGGEVIIAVRPTDVPPTYWDDHYPIEPGLAAPLRRRS